MSNIMNIAGNIYVTITIGNGDDTKSITIKEGDYIPRISYKNNGSIETTSGKVQTIHFSSRKQARLLPKRHYTDFMTADELVTVTSIVMDCSSSNKSEIVVIDVDNITDIESLGIGDVPIKNIKYLSETSISFVSNITPSVVLWNDDICTPLPYGNKPNTYWVEIESMNSVNILTTFTTNTRGLAFVDGHEPNPVYELEFIEDFKRIMNKFINKMLTSSTEGSSNTVADTDFYVKVADSVGKPKNVSLNGSSESSTYKSSLLESTKNIFKWDNNTRELFVSAPDMYMAYISSGRKKVNVGLYPNDYNFDINMTLDNADLSIGQLVPVSNGDDFHKFNSMNNTIVEFRNKLSSMITTTIKTANGSSLPSGLPVFITKVYESKNSTSTVTMMTKSDNLNVVLTPEIGEGFVTTTKTVKCTTNIAVYGLGSISIELICNDECPTRKTVYTIGGDNADYETMYEALHSLEDGDTLLVEDGNYYGENGADIYVLSGVTIRAVGTEVYFRSPLNIIAPTGTVRVHGIKFYNMTAKENVVYNTYIISASCGCNVVLDGIDIKSAKDFSNIVEFKNLGYASVLNSSFDGSTSYNMLHFGIGDSSQNGIMVSGCTFGNCKGKPIEIENVENQSYIKIDNCSFATMDHGCCMPEIPPTNRPIPHKVIHPVSGPICIDRPDPDNNYIPYFCVPPIKPGPAIPPPPKHSCKCDSVLDGIDDTMTEDDVDDMMGFDEDDVDDMMGMTQN